MKEELSSILSVAIVQALEDLECIMKDPRYVIDFSLWHEEINIDSQFKNSLTMCSVCFAGSVMANRLGGEINTILSPEDFEDHALMLRALDFIRIGEINRALGCIGIESSDFDGVDVNQDDYDEFKSQMLAISEDLRAKGY